MITLYDLRKETRNALVESANKNLREYNPAVINQFGEIGSLKWWKLYESGKITTKQTVGTIVAISPDEDDDLGDAVRIQTSEREIAYDHEGFWDNPEVRVGSTVRITSIKSIVTTRTGPISTTIDIKVEVENS